MAELQWPRALFGANPWNYAARACSDIAINLIHLRGFRPLDTDQDLSKLRHFDLIARRRLRIERDGCQPNHSRTAL